MGVSQQLRALDRRVLREGRELTEEQWRRNAGKWRMLLAVVVVVALINAGIWLWQGSPLALLANVPTLLILTFQAGYAKSEDDRLKGRQFGVRQRPPGV